MEKLSPKEFLAGVLARLPELTEADRERLLAAVEPSARPEALQAAIRRVAGDA